MLCRVGSDGLRSNTLMEANHQNLLEFIDLPRVECLNTHPGFPVTNALMQKNDEVYYVRSDEGSDPQIIMTFPFRQPVKLHHLAVRANLDPSAPVIIKLYINQSALSFSDTDSLPPVQELSLTDVDFIRGTVALRFVKFQRVTSLTVFVQSNRGGDFSRINGLEFFGSPVQDMNMKEFKASG